MFPPRLATFLAVRIKMSPGQSFCLLVLLTPLCGHGADARQAKAAARAKFLIVSDIHFNPMADPTLVPELAAADPGQWEPILQRTQPTAFSPYGQDTNWWLLQSAL